MPERQSFLGPLLHRLLLGGVLGLCLLLCASRPLASNDYSIYVALGRQMIAEGGLADRDPFTFTLHGQPWMHASWAWALVCAASHALCGYQGIRALTALSALACLAGIYAAARRAGAAPRAAAVAVLYAWLLLLQNLGPRSQTPIYPLFAALLLLTCRPPRAALGAAAGFALGWAWTQLHGSFPIPIAYAALLAAGAAIEARDPRAARPQGAIALGLLAGSLCGPYGPAIWGYVWANGAVPRARMVLEWGAPRPLSFAGLRLGLALALWTLLVARARRVPAPTAALLLLAFGGGALLAERMLAWFGLATALPLALQLGRAPALEPAPLRPRQRALLALLGAAWLALIAAGIPRHPALAPDTPVALAERLARETPGRVFAPMELCGYLAWRFHEPAPDAQGHTPFPCFVDMRIWIFPDEVWDEYVAVARAAPGWQARLDARGVSYLLLSPALLGAELREAVLSSPDWESLAEDGSGTLLRRRAGAATGGRVSSPMPRGRLPREMRPPRRRRRWRAQAAPPVAPALGSATLSG